MKKRRWEIVIYRHVWMFHVHKPFGRFGVFLRETWIGPFCLKIWTDPRSAHPKWIRLAKEVL